VRRGADVLVTGGAGFVGGALVARLAASGARVRATVHRAAARRGLGDVEWIAADLTRPEDCRRAVAGVARVFHCANVSTGAGTTVHDPLAMVTSNVVLNAQVLDAAWRAGVARLVFLSSSVVYPDAGARPLREEEGRDGTPHPAYAGVGGMKRYAEELCALYATGLPRTMPCTVIRPASVYGPGEDFDPATGHVVAALVRKVVERRRPLDVWGTGDEVRDLVHVDDVVDGVLAAAALDDPLVVLNLGSGAPVTVRALLDAILAADGWDRDDAAPTFDPSRPRTIPARVLDVTAIRTRCGFVPRVPLADGIARTVAWWRAQQRPPAARRAPEVVHA
jgi:GDP-L-fucose synthase